MEQGTSIDDIVDFGVGNMQEEVLKFNTEGYLGPCKLLDIDQAECLLRDSKIPSPLFTWYKSTHEQSFAIQKAASDPMILSKLRLILGKNILLWASHFIVQEPDQSHGWHLDVEHGSWDGCTLWLGLKNLDENTSISLITYSHLLDTTPQELAKDLGRDIYSDSEMLVEAKKRDSRCELRVLNLQPGEFILWSGKMWHTTANKSKKNRHSVIFQYCTPEQNVKIPTTYDYPGTQWSDKRPPCLLIEGVDDFHVNKVFKKANFIKMKMNTFYMIRKRFGFRYLLSFIKQMIVSGI